MVAPTSKVFGEKCPNSRLTPETCPHLTPEEPQIAGVGSLCTGTLRSTLARSGYAAFLLRPLLAMGVLVRVLNLTWNQRTKWAGEMVMGVTYVSVPRPTGDKVVETCYEPHLALFAGDSKQQPAARWQSRGPGRFVFGVSGCLVELGARAVLCDLNHITDLPVAVPLGRPV
ncbi:hypothetical protein CB1_000245026 [Camelus ferus]|nr:hypothetical protein CB1_000245026 [Camelus ferus]